MLTLKTPIMLCSNVLLAGDCLGNHLDQFGFGLEPHKTAVQFMQFLVVHAVYAGVFQNRTCSLKCSGQIMNTYFLKSATVVPRRADVRCTI